MDTNKELELLRQSWTETFDQLFVLYEVAKEVAFQLDMNELLASVVTHASMLLDAEAGAVLLVDQSAGTLKYQAARSESADAIFKPGAAIPIGIGIAGMVAETGKPLLVPDAGADARTAPEAECLSGLTIRNLVCVPMLIHGELVGVIQIFNKKKTAFTTKDRDFLLAVANLSGLAIKNALAYQDATQQENIQSQILNIMPDGFLSLDSTGRITHLNSSAKQILGLDEKDYRGQSYKRLLTSEHELTRCIQETLDKGVIKENIELSIESTGRNLLCSTAVLLNPSGSVLGAGIVLRDLFLKR